MRLCVCCRGRRRRVPTSEPEEEGVRLTSLLAINAGRPQKLEDKDEEEDDNLLSDNTSISLVDDDDDSASDVTELTRSLVKALQSGEDVPGKLHDGELKIVFENLGAMGAALLIRHLKQDTRVRTVELGINGLQGVHSSLGSSSSSSSSSQLYKELGITLKANNTIRQLSIWGNGIEDKGAEKIGSALATNQTLVNLNLSNNSLTDRALTALAAGLRTNTTLTSLDLSGNNLNGEGLAALCEVLCAPTSSSPGNNNNYKGSHSLLQFVNLAGNHITTTHLAPLAKAFEHPGWRVVTLDLSTNDIDDRGVAMLCGSLAANSSLKQLSLQGNRGIRDLPAARQLVQSAIDRSPLHTRGITIEDTL